MRKALLVQQASGPYELMLRFTRDTHASYARKHGLTFWSIIGTVQSGRPARWDKIAVIRHALAMGFEFIAWLDADTLIVRTDADIKTALNTSATLGMCRHPGAWRGQSHHWNSGVLLIRNTPEAHRFFNSVWNAGPTNDSWQEQTRVLELLPEFATYFQELAAEWNSTTNVNEIANPVIKSWHGRSLGALPKIYSELKTRAALSAELAIEADQFVHLDNVRTKTEKAIEAIPDYPGTFTGRGIVICGGGDCLAGAWVCIRQLRRVGCRLPIELWHLGSYEVSHEMELLLRPYGVTCRDASKEGLAPFASRAFEGWQLKPQAIRHSSFQELLLIDADNLPVLDPEYLFDAPEYRNTGAVFWPDRGRTSPQSEAWSVFDVPYRDEPEFESGQLILNKERCWRPLSLCAWYNQNSAFFYWYVYGDKDTFRMAWRKLNAPFAMPEHPPAEIPGTLVQHDFEGRRVFQHRTGDKWRIEGTSLHSPGFLFESECLEDLELLRKELRKAV